MSKLRKIGFFRESSEQDDKECHSLLESVSDVPHPDEDRIVKYLRDGDCVAACGRFLTDVIDARNTGLPLSTHTDGVYLWRSDLAHYVETYHMRIPLDFVEHMRQNDWKPPENVELREEDV